jgi:uncharacterized delta-60 repeat protein
MMSILRRRRNSRSQAARQRYAPRVEGLEQRLVLSGSGYVLPTYISVDVLQANGDIVTAVENNPNGYVDPGAIVIDRFLPNGTPDPSFGTAGVVTVPETVLGGGFGPEAMAIEPDGNILIAGAGDDVIQLVSLNSSNGSLDTSFGPGNNGVVSTPVSKAGGLTQMSISFPIIANGSTDLAIASTDVANSGASRLAVLHYTLAGNLDTSYGGGTGQVLTNITGMFVQAIAFEPSNGDIVVGGSMMTASPNYEFALERFLPDGSVDKTFGTKGVVLTPIATSATLKTLAIGSGGVILAAGDARSGSSSDIPVFAEYTSTGALNTSAFGGGTGIVLLTSVYYTDINAVAFEPNGQIVADGWYSPPTPPYTNYGSVIRLNANGSLDTSFGVGGFANSAIGVTPQYFNILIQPDGNIVAIGDTAFNDGTGVGVGLVARYLAAPLVYNGVTYPAGSLDPTFGS